MLPITHGFKWYVVISVWYLFILLFSIKFHFVQKFNKNPRPVIPKFITIFFLAIWMQFINSKTSRLISFTCIFASVINYLTNNENNWMPPSSSTIACMVVSHFLKHYCDSYSQRQLLVFAFKMTQFRCEWISRYMPFALLICQSTIQIDQLHIQWIARQSN